MGRHAILMCRFAERPPLGCVGRHFVGGTSHVGVTATPAEAASETP